MSNRFMNLVAGPERSCSSTPTKTTGFPAHFFAVAATTGASRVHGGQYDCQKLRTTTLPRSEARLIEPAAPTRGRENGYAGTISSLSTLFAIPFGLFATFQTRRPSSATTTTT